MWVGIMVVLDQRKGEKLYFNYVFLIENDRESPWFTNKVKEDIMLILSTKSILHFPKGFIMGHFETFCCWGTVQYKNLENTDKQNKKLNFSKNFTHKISKIS